MNDIAISAPDKAAIDRVLQVAPVWDGLAQARDIVGAGQRLLHAGPPIQDPSAMARPILNSAALAAVYEGWCTSPEDGEAMVLAGEIELAPAQDQGVVIPLAGIVSPTMTLQRVRDRNDPERVAWSPFNGGMGPAMRLGQRSPAVVERWKWLDAGFAAGIGAAVGEGVDLLAIAAHSLTKGDDCHGRTPAATTRLAEVLAPGLAGAAEEMAISTYLAESPGFFLNLWMAATKCMLAAAEGMPESSLITVMAGNGVETGLQVAALPGRWFTAPATPPEGSLEAPFGPDDRLGAIGDSAIVDAFGLGAMALNFAPEQQKGLAGHLPDDALELPARLLLARHPAFGELDLLVGQSAARIAELDTTGLVALGILDKAGEGGRIGGGIYRPPVQPFRAVSNAVAAK